MPRQGTHLAPVVVQGSSIAPHGHHRHLAIGRPASKIASKRCLLLHWRLKKQPKHKVFGRDIPAPRRRDIPDKNFMQVAFFSEVSKRGWREGVGDKQEPKMFSRKVSPFS